MIMQCQSPMNIYYFCNHINLQGNIFRIILMYDAGAFKTILKFRKFNVDVDTISANFVNLYNKSML